MQSSETSNHLKNSEKKSSIYKKRLEEFKKAFEEATTNDERMKIIQEMRELNKWLSSPGKDERSKH